MSYNSYNFLKMSYISYILMICPIIPTHSVRSLHSCVLEQISALFCSSLQYCGGHESSGCDTGHWNWRQMVSSSAKMWRLVWPDVLTGSESLHIIARWCYWIIPPMELNAVTDGLGLDDISLKYLLWLYWHSPNIFHVQGVSIRRDHLPPLYFWHFLYLISNFSESTVTSPHGNVE